MPMDSFSKKALALSALSPVILLIGFAVTPKGGERAPSAACAEGAAKVASPTGTQGLARPAACKPLKAAG